MRYTPSNVARSASIYDVDTQQKLSHVMELNTATGEVWCAADPIRVNQHTGCVETETVRFRSIYAIKGDSTMPVLFHCYGRQA